MKFYIQFCFTKKLYIWSGQAKGSALVSIMPAII